MKEINFELELDLGLGFGVKVRGWTKRDSGVSVGSGGGDEDSCDIVVVGDGVVVDGF